MAAGAEEVRLRRIVRDLVALQALPAACVGHSPAVTLGILLDALPTALAADLVYLWIPGSSVHERALFRGAELDGSLFAEIRHGLHRRPGERSVELAGRTLVLSDATVTVGTARGVLACGRVAPLDDESDALVLRSGANLVGSVMEAAEVLESARRKDEFLAILGHELRNPLAPILTAVERLSGRPAPPREIGAIERHARHLARLVDDLLDVARVGRGELEVRRERIELSAVLARAVEIAEPVVVRRRHALTIGDASDLAVEGDPVRLAQVFANLVTNAAKFTPDRGRIDVRVERHGNRARVTVCDTGRGLSRTELGRIFEPFVQVERALGGGLGLGLAIVKNLVERHGGSVVAESAGPGLGAAFRVELPLSARSPRSFEAPERPVRDREVSRVLVVDDDADLAELVAAALSEAGFQTAVANDPDAALVIARTFRPQVALLDVGLPGLDGYALAGALRAEHGATPTLVAVTGYGLERDRLRAIEAGFDAHLVKPVGLAELIATIGRASGRPGSSRTESGEAA